MQEFKVDDLRDALSTKLSPFVICDLLDNLGVTKFEKLNDGYCIIQYGFFTRITVEEVEDDEKETS